jgi:flagellar motor switch protein FliN/FliY
MSAAEAAALVMAQAYGLGDEARISTEWPVDQGDAVLRADLSGESTGSLVLAVNDEVADRLLANPAVLNEGFTNALQAAARAVGFDLAAGAVVRGDNTPPTVIVEILDGGQLTALAGITLPIADPAAASAPQEFEPSAFDPGAPAAPGVPSAAAVLAPSSLTVLNDVQLVVTAELGRTMMPVRDLLGLMPGMVVEIDRAAGAPIDLLVNGRRIAAGEVVVIDEEFGIRITEIAPTGDRAR